jgi:hypothetical protein
MKLFLDQLMKSEKMTIKHQVEFLILNFTVLKCQPTVATIYLNVQYFYFNAVMYIMEIA